MNIPKFCRKPYEPPIILDHTLILTLLFSDRRKDRKRSLPHTATPTASGQAAGTVCDAWRADGGLSRLVGGGSHRVPLPERSTPSGRNFTEAGGAGGESIYSLVVQRPTGRGSLHTNHHLGSHQHLFEPFCQRTVLRSAVAPATAATFCLGHKTKTGRKLSVACHEPHRCSPFRLPRSHDGRGAQLPAQGSRAENARPDGFLQAEHSPMLPVSLTAEP